MAASDDASDISEADVNKLAHSLGDLDDLDADLFGDSLNKKNGAGKPTTPRRNAPRSNTTMSPTRVQSPPRSDTPTSPPGSARTNLKRKPVKPPSPSTATSNPIVFSPRSVQPEHKPGTAPGKMTDLSLASERLVPGQKTHQRPETAPKVKKKFDFGDFDPDDPLAGILSGSDDISESDRPKSTTQKPALTSQSKAPVDLFLSERKPSSHVLPDSPRKHNLLDRPPTRSGSSLGDTSVPAVTNIAPDVDSGSSQTGMKAQAGIFSDSDDLLDGLGLDEKPVTLAKQNSASQKPKAGDIEDVRPARSIFDSLLGKGSSTASQLLERKEKKEFVLDKKYSASRDDGSAGGLDEENGFQFGSYQPSAASGSRPNSRRSVRFQDDDDIFGLDSHPTPSSKPPGIRKAPPDMEWLETVTKESTPVPTKAMPVTQQGGTSATIPAESVPLVLKPSVTSTPQKATEIPKKTLAVAEKDALGSTASTLANSGSSARAWLGLEDSESDGELFKPKKSPAHTAGLPQSPVVSSASASASPRIFPKKPPKKSTTPPSKGDPAITAPADDDNDDWLARARSRRQQMLAKEGGKGTENIFDKNTTAALENERETQGAAIQVEQAVLNIDPPSFGGTSKSDLTNNLFSLPQGQPPRGLDWESSKSALRKDVSVQKLVGQTAAVSPSQQPGPPLTDTRPQLSTAGCDQEQLPGVRQLNSQPSVLAIPEELNIQRMQQRPEHQTHQQHEQQQSHPEQYFLQQQQSLLQQHFVQPQNLPQQPLPQQQQNHLPNPTQQPQYPAVHEQVSSHFIHQHRQQQQSSPFSNAMPTYSQSSSTIKLPDSLPEAQAVIRKLELERTYSESVLESTRRRYEEEMLAVESSYKNRLQIIEDSNRKREARLREENEELMQQHLTKLRQLEQEKSDLNTSHYRRLEDIERQRAEDLEKQREQHRLSLAILKREHEEALERLASAKNQEINMVANANNTSKSLTAVVQQIQSNARDLGELQQKIDSWNRQGLDEREISLRSKDEQLRILQERLNRQAEDNDRERSRLEDLIAHMEAQIREQTRSLEEERWKLKQDQGRAEAQQRSLEEERRQWLEQQARERMNVERARENFLEEQSRSLAQISEERRTLTEERTKFQLENKSYREKTHQDAIKRSQAEAEYEALMRTIAEEKVYQNTRRQELQREEERVSTERSKVDRERSKLEQDQERLATQARQIREQSEQIDRLTETARRSQQEGDQALDEASQFRAHIERREAEVQKQLNRFKLMENHISEEKLRLAKEKKDVENLKSSSLCTNCRSPVQGDNLPHHNGISNHHLVNLGLQSAPAVHKGLSVNQLSTSPLDHIALSIANDRAVRLLKIQAIKDKDFLQEESMYLEGLRHAPYH